MTTSRCLVLGHSGTAGFGLASIEQTWPVRFEQTMRAERPCEVASVPFFPVGALAVDYAFAKVQERSPDVLIVSLNAYPCAVPVVVESVRHRFGERAARWFTRLERRYDRRSRAGAGGFRGDLGQRIVRRVLGMRTRASVAEVAAAYSGVLQRVAQLEGTQVVVLAEARFAKRVRSQAPAVERLIDELQALVRPVAEEHRFLWCDAEAWVRSGGGDACWQGDGVHLSAQGNDVYGRMLATALVNVLA